MLRTALTLSWEVRCERPFSSIDIQLTKAFSTDTGDAMISILRIAMVPLEGIISIGCYLHQGVKKVNTLRPPLLNCVQSGAFETMRQKHCPAVSLWPCSHSLSIYLCKIAT